jgi:hypothetical protein
MEYTSARSNLNRFLVATATSQRDKVIGEISEMDPPAVITKSEQNPCTFVVTTKLTGKQIDDIVGVAHVIQTKGDK